MGDFAKPQISKVDTTNANVAPWLQNPAAFQQAFGGQNQGALNAGAWNAQNTGFMDSNPEAQAFSQIAPLLMRMGQGRTSNSELQFGNEFRELSDPAGAFNPIGQAMSTMAAATPIFSRNLQDANARLNTTAPGRFSTALAQEGRDLNATALQDFNLFANQAIQQALGLEQQNRESTRNFALGARGLQQGAAQNTAQNQLGARGLLQQDQQSAQGNQLQALMAMMQGAGMVGNGAFNRNQQAGQFGLAQQNAAINPILQLLGMAPGQTPIVGPSWLDRIMNLGQTAATIHMGGK